MVRIDNKRPNLAVNHWLTLPSLTYYSRSCGGCRGPSIPRRGRGQGRRQGADAALCGDGQPTLEMRRVRKGRILSVLRNRDVFYYLRCLLQHGADPNGNFKNLCTPLAVVAQRGYYEGVKVTKKKDWTKTLDHWSTGYEQSSPCG